MDNIVIYRCWNCRWLDTSKKEVCPKCQSTNMQFRQIDKEKFHKYMNRISECVKCKWRGRDWEKIKLPAKDGFSGNDFSCPACGYTRFFDSIMTEQEIQQQIHQELSAVSKEQK